MFLTLFVSGILVFSIQMHTTLWHGDYNVLRSGVLLLQDNESFHIQQSPPAITLQQHFNLPR